MCHQTRSATRHVAVGQALVGLMSAQDLFLAFVFAVPTALHNSFLKTGGGHPWLKTFIFDIVVGEGMPKLLSKP